MKGQRKKRILFVLSEIKMFFVCIHDGDRLLINKWILHEFSASHYGVGIKGNVNALDRNEIFNLRPVGC